MQIADVRITYVYPSGKRNPGTPQLEFFEQTTLPQALVELLQRHPHLGPKNIVKAEYRLGSLQDQSAGQWQGYSFSHFYKVVHDFFETLPFCYEEDPGQFTLDEELADDEFSLYCPHCRHNIGKEWNWYINIEQINILGEVAGGVLRKTTCRQCGREIGDWLVRRLHGNLEVYKLICGPLSTDTARKRFAALHRAIEQLMAKFGQNPDHQVFYQVINWRTGRWDTPLILEGVGYKFDPPLSSERVRQRESRAKRMLSHPLRSKGLSKYRDMLGFELEQRLKKQVAELEEQNRVLAEKLQTQKREFQQELERLQLRHAQYDATGSQPELTERDLPVTLEELGLSIRAYNALYRAGKGSLIKILQMTDGDLLSIRNFGQKSFDELVEKLAEHGLRLKQR